MGMNDAQAEEKWKFLRSALYEIFSHNSSQLSFEELFRASYQLVLQKYGDLLYNGVVQFIMEQCEKIAKTIASSSNEECLTCINQQWTDFQLVMVMIRDVLMYMEHNYVPLKRKIPIYERALMIFLDEIVRNQKIQERLRSVLLDNIASERNGHLIDRAAVKTTLRMYISLGIHSNAVYEEEFEKHFLAQTLQFYQQQAQQMLDNATCAEYLIKAEQRILEEAQRVQNYLHSFTDLKLKRIVQTELIEKQAKVLVDDVGSGCYAMFREGNVDALRRMYTLFQKVSNEILQLISSSIFAFIKQNGEQLMEAQLNPTTALDSKDFVDRLLHLRQPFIQFHKQCFNEDNHFFSSLKRGFEAFMNRGTFSAAHLAQYLDELLRSKEELKEETDCKVAQIIELFRYLQDKDVFEEYYKLLLAKRLLRDRKNNDEAERIVIGKLKAECGYQFTSKLEGMFKDIHVSKDLTEKYRKASFEMDAHNSKAKGTPNKRLASQLSVQILTSGLWPFTTPVQCTIPFQFDRLRRHFQTFYLSQYQGRKLSFMTELGSVDIRACFAENRRYELNVSSFQSFILLLFNAHDTITYRQILENIQLDPLILKRHLLSLCTPKFRVLNKSSKGKQIDMDDVFSINSEYMSRIWRIRIPLISTRETDVQSIPTNENIQIDVPATVAEDRKHLYPLNLDIFMIYIKPNESLTFMLMFVYDRGSDRASDESAKTYAA